MRKFLAGFFGGKNSFRAASVILIVTFWFAVRNKKVEEIERLNGEIRTHCTAGPEDYQLFPAEHWSILKPDVTSVHVPE